MASTAILDQPASMVVPVPKGPAEMSTSRDTQIDSPETYFAPKELLFKAVVTQEVAGVEEVLDQGEDPNQFDMKGLQPLHYAARRPHRGIVECLVRRGARVDSVSQSGETPLFYALDSGDISVIDFLLKEGANVQFVNQMGDPPLIHATKEDNLLLVALLLQYHAEINSLDSKGHTSLHWAVYNNNYQLVKFLVESGTDILAKDELGLTALHWSALKGYVEIGRYLLEQNEAPLKMKCNSGFTPLGWAERNRQTEFLSLLQNRNSFRLKTENVLSWDRVLRHPTGQAFLTPLFLMMGFGILFSIINFPLACVISFSLLIWLGGRAYPYFRNRLDPLLFGIFFWSIFFAGYHFCFKIFWSSSKSQPELTLLMMIISIVFLWAYRTLCVENPGYLPTGKINDILGLLEDLKKGHSELHCKTCLIKRPLRSKHCAQCQRCVLRFDHHCQWTGNCITYLNIGKFILVLFSYFLGSFIYMQFSYNYLKDLSEEGLSFSERFLQATLKEPTLMGLLLWQMLNYVWMSLLTGQHMYMLVRNETTNEFWNISKYQKTYLGDGLGKYVNPFDLGYLNNLTLFVKSRFNFSAYGLRPLVNNRTRYDPVSRLTHLGYELGKDFEVFESDKTPSAVEEIIVDSKTH